MKFTGKFLDVYIESKKPGFEAQTRIVVGLKVSKKAVVRNLVKRRIRAAVALFGIKSGRAFIRIVARPGIEKIKYADIKEELAVLKKQK